MKPSSEEAAQVEELVQDLGQMIDAARRRVALAANAALTTLHWQLGYRVPTEILAGQRAEYDAQIVATVGRHLDTGAGGTFQKEGPRPRCACQTACTSSTSAVSSYVK